MLSAVAKSAATRDGVEASLPEVCGSRLRRRRISSPSSNADEGITTPIANRHGICWHMQVSLCLCDSVVKSFSK